MSLCLRQLRKARAFCLSVRGFVSLPICQTLSGDAGHDFVGAFCVLDAKTGTVVIAKIELGKVAMQMLLADMVERTNHAALENGKIVFSVIDMDEAAETSIFIC
jgi:hypothetical protein